MYVIVGSVAFYSVVFAPGVLVEPHAIETGFQGIRDQLGVKNFLEDSLRPCV